MWHRGSGGVRGGEGEEKETGDENYFGPLDVFLCNLPTFAELTIQDIEKIDAKIKESEARITDYVNASETRITD